MEDKKNAVPYEEQLRSGTDFWIREASDFFMQAGSVFETLRDLGKLLDQASIPYAVLGALALGEHGFVRVTVDIDILLTREGLERFRLELLDRGFRPAFEGAKKSFRSTRTGVRIDVITTGEYPGDGKPKSVSFPDPEQFSFEHNGIRFLVREKLIELKLASGLSAAHRQRDLVDIQDLIRQTKLPLELADHLDESVRSAYRDLWHKAQIVDPFQER